MRLSLSKLFFQLISLSDVTWLDVIFRTPYMKPLPTGCFTDVVLLWNIKRSRVDFGSMEKPKTFAKRWLSHLALFHDKHDINFNQLWCYSLIKMTQSVQVAYGVIKQIKTVIRVTMHNGHFLWNMTRCTREFLFFFFFFFFFFNNLQEFENLEF